MKITISIQLFAMQCIQVVRKYQKLDPLQTNLKNITWKNSGKYNGEDPIKVLFSNCLKFIVQSYRRNVYIVACLIAVKTP